MKTQGRLLIRDLNDRKTGFETLAEVVQLQVATELVEESGKDLKLTPKGRWHRTDPGFFGNEKTPPGGRLKLSRAGQEFGPLALRRSREVQVPTRRDQPLKLRDRHREKLALN